MTPKLRNRCRRLAAARAAKGCPKRAKLWQAMRILRTFTTFELVAVTELECRASARTFCRYLTRAGFLACHRASHNAVARYQLIRNTGPQPPSLVHFGTAVYDPNEDREYPLT